ncbi:C-terminal binding protein [Planctomicrobium sp. SH668]|uniref:C-terminal binding protein n=1 Tax=Planctomicrobium sp. SH668 TaxID=3448126 RepID=UPI003F5B6A24
MKVAITDYSFPDLKIEEEIFRKHQIELVAWKERKSPELLPELVADADAVITQFASVDSNVIDSMRNVRAIVRYGIGFDNVDISQARNRNIPVCNVPDYCIDEVADHTLAFILSMTRQVLPNCLSLKEGTWGLATPVSEMSALRDLTIGLVGLGRIGREVLARLRPFKPKVLVYDPVVPADGIREAGGTPASLEEVLASSDLVTLHCPSTAETKGLINAESLKKMKTGVRIVNVARGDLIVTDDLVQALKSGQVGGAALDVFAPEPLPKDHPLLSMSNVIVASHIASVSPPAVQKLRESAATLAVEAVLGKTPRNVVNGVKPSNATSPST